jgi:predicted DNA-binding transcriptional regulator AlpA
MSDATPETVPAAPPAPLRRRDPLPGQKYLSIAQVCARFSIHRATAYRWMNERHFPRPVQFSPSCSRIPLTEIESWEQEQLSARGE